MALAAASVQAEQTDSGSTTDDDVHLAGHGEEEEDDSPEAAARAMEERAPKKLRYCPLSRLFDPATWAAVHAARRFGVPSLFYALAGACRHRLHPRARASVRVCARGRQRG